MDLSHQSVTQLRELLEQVQQQIKIKERDELAAARQKVLAIAQSAGIPLDELMGLQAKSKSRAVKAKVAVRYRHPSDASLQWTGRGRQPKWVQEWVAIGKALDELRV
ncbi:nucleoid protein H-NS [Collimonas sp. OK307]|uniref:H-NS histone family protein n=1 Tax=Collimonas sp. OK307 TaxID=1801620 RepID=UPI0008E9B673|nr:H-NS histone family protein [Collimonas sp. OK307]SFI22353.1 nucleoid protein H-NS [Collimonas sp. OK307]